VSYGLLSLGEVMGLVKYVFDNEVVDRLSHKTAIHRAAIENATATFTRRTQGDDAIAEFSGDGWLKQARPDYDWTARHFRLMQATLLRMTHGEIRKVYFSIPIRHGKTEHNSISYAAYRLERNPAFRWIVGSYNQRMAEKISRAIRKLARSRGVQISKERDTAAEWETTSGGGVRALGAGTGSAGLNADGIIIDDPIGNREEAESQAHRDQVWDWLTNDILGRTEPHTIVLFTMSRWHKDDPAGRLMDQQAGLWTIVDVPGVCEDPAEDLLGRVKGEVLWPECRDDKWMAEKRIELGEYGFASLIQGRPRPREGGMFKWEWWCLVNDVPTQGKMVRYWDLAGTKPKNRSHDPDYSAGALLCRMVDKRTCIVDVQRFRESVHARDAKLEELCRIDLQNFRGRVSWWIETEAGIAGEERTTELVRRLQALGMPVYTEHPTGKKELRWEPLASKAGAGNVVLVRGPWNDPFRLEAADAPNGMHDDQLDAAAGADSKLSDVQAQVGSFRMRV
jgi:predicted phage terminase large subunit-like protein